MPKHTLRELLTFACCFLIAGVVWYGHSMNTIRSLIVPVEVSYQGLSPIVQCEDSLPTTIEVELRDVGQRLKIYHHKHPHISIDITKQLNQERGTIHIASEVLRNHIANQIQGSTTIQKSNPEQIECRYFRLHKKTVPIRLDGTFTPASQYQLVGSPQLQKRSVIIYGSYHDISIVNEIVTQPLALRDIKDSVTATASLIAPPNIRLDFPSVLVNVVSERFTEKMVTVPLHAINVPKKETLRLFPSEVDVMLRIGINHFATIDISQIKAECYYPTHPLDRIPVHIVCTNPYVTYTRSNPSSVEYIIEQ